MSEEKEITLKESELKSIIESNKELQKQLLSMSNTLDILKTNGVAGGPRKLQEIKDRTVTIRMVDGKPVVGYVNHGSEKKPLLAYTKPDPKDPKRDILFVDLIVHGLEKSIEIPYEDYTNETERETVKVIERKEKPWVINQGQTMRREVDESYGITERDFVVDLDVKGVHTTFVVELPDGEQIELDEAFVNV